MDLTCVFTIECDFFLQTGFPVSLLAGPKPCISVSYSTTVAQKRGSLCSTAFKFGAISSNRTKCYWRQVQLPVIGDAISQICSNNAVSLFNYILVTGKGTTSKHAYKDLKDFLLISIKLLKGLKQKWYYHVSKVQITFQLYTLKCWWHFNILILLWTWLVNILPM